MLINYNIKIYYQLSFLSGGSNVKKKKKKNPEGDAEAASAKNKFHLLTNFAIIQIYSEAM